MFIECFKNNGTNYLRVMEVYRTREAGTSKCRRRVVRNIGPLSRFDDGKPDYLERLRQSFKEGKPIIESLNDLVENKPIRKRVVVEYDIDNEDDCVCDPKNIGYFLLDGLYDALGIYDVLNKHKSQTKIGYDLNGLAKLLVFGRILWPDSKFETFEGRDSYLFDVTSSDNLYEIYRALDCLDEESEAIQKRMNTKISGYIGRNTEVCFYDVTNFYFEIDDNDDDVLGADGEVVKEGFRKKGPSKEKKGEPIVQMGLFIDDNGIPIAYRLFPGNHTDQTTLRPALKKSIDKMKFKRVIIVADGGLNSGPNIGHILDEGNGYILSKSTKKSAKDVKKWILDEDGYEWNKERTFKLKSKIRERIITKENGEKEKIKEKLICYWSKKHYDREMHENSKFIEYLESVIKNPDKLKDKPKKIEKFLNKLEVDKDTGEIVDTKTHLSLDMEKIKEYMDLMGYYTLMTSEIEKPDREIINKYHGLSRIEDSFRITKSDLEGRPVYVRKQEHINAHFLVCFIALTMIRIIQYKILKHQGKDTLNEDGWESGVTADRIKKALESFRADAVPGGYYRLTKPNDDMRLILDSLGIHADLRLPTASDLRKLKYSFDKAVTV
ncbi:IS1634 family transposase [Tepidanaerobacter syntrophicus]|uniref:IS1634 family transposase n=1 Tax=Tepidanaerobacter syntrophicus TaxID=224999 RepID=UPI001BD29C75|nr:IS1634 family transposase [Tepidanaerobacter syntrophicus]